MAGDFGHPAFASETQAFFFALSQGVVIEFNPTTMEISDKITVEPLVYEGVPFTPESRWRGGCSPAPRREWLCHRRLALDHARQRTHVGLWV